jgi:hypothetical protein
VRLGRARHPSYAAHTSLGGPKALGVVASHYRVNLRAISTSYVVPVGVDDEVEMNRVDAVGHTPRVPMH